ncbi:MAG: hypothetical protein ACK4S4_10575 [Pyrinomonadaceae bacterium]
MGRKILGIVAGWITAWAIFALFEMIASAFAPQPPGNLSHMTTDEVRRFMLSLPPSGYVMMLVGYVIGSFAGGWMATKVAQARTTPAFALIVGVLLMLVGVAKFFVLLPGQPMWFIAASMITYIPLAYLGYLVGHRRS